MGREGIAGAGYTASYAYDTFDRITSASVLTSSGVALSGAAQGTYSYGASGHLHAVSSVGTGSTGYSAAYDAAGELTCRAVGASTCTNATPTGQALGYDALRRLLSWQNATTNPTATATATGAYAYAYDGSGSRVWQQDTSTSGGVTTTTTTTYILGIAEITSVQTGQAAPSTTATRFYPLAGGVSALRDAAGLSYVASDQLGTPIATLNLDTGAVLGEQLRAPYGQARYAASAPTNGGMRTTIGFTGQREDASAAGSSGLDYFNARYYDPTIGRFTSADSVMGSDPLLDGYAYVGGQVESATDPSGQVASTCMSPQCDGQPGIYGPETGPGGGDPPGKETGPSVKQVAGAILDALLAVLGNVVGHVDPQQPPLPIGAIVHMPVLPGLSSLPAIRESDVLDHRPQPPTPTPPSLFERLPTSGPTGSTTDTTEPEPEPQAKPSTAGGSCMPPKGADPVKWCVYRNLRPDEVPSNGIRPKDPTATATVYEHIMFGSRASWADQFISTSKSLKWLLDYQAKKGIRVRIIVVDLDKVQGTVYDLTTAAGRQAGGLRRGWSTSWAIKAQEVTIEGWIPPEAIIDVIEP